MNALYKKGLYWGYMGIMENEMETTIMGYIGIIGYILGLYWDNGKNGNYRDYRDW